MNNVSTGKELGRPVLTAVWPIETAKNAPNTRRGPPVARNLHTHAALHRDTINIYRAARQGRLPLEQAGRFIYMASLLLKSAYDLETLAGLKEIQARLDAVNATPVVEQP